MSWSPSSWYTSTTGFFNNIATNVSNYMNHKHVIDVLVLGTTKSGKTELIRRLCHVKGSSDYLPTLSTSSRLRPFNDCNLRYTEIGGQDMESRALRSAYPTASAVLYVVDCTRRDHFADASDEHSVAYDLQQLLKLHQYKGAPFLFCLNKADHPNALTMAEVEQSLKLSELFKTFKLVTVDALNQSNFIDALTFLHDAVISKDNMDLVSYNVPTLATSDRPIAVRVTAPESISEHEVLVVDPVQQPLNIQHEV